MSKVQVIREFWQFMKLNKKLWLAPIIIIFIVVGGLLVLAKSSVLAPFLYPLF
jgi:uncharacterized protein DUF5989